MFCSNLVGHFTNGVGKAYFVANVQQVSKMLPAFYDTAIFDQEAPYCSLTDKILKLQATGFHSGDDVAQPP